MSPVALQVPNPCHAWAIVLIIERETILAAELVTCIAKGFRAARAQVC